MNILTTDMDGLLMILVRLVKIMQATLNHEIYNLTNINN